MANRCYLYTADQLPGSPGWDAKRHLHSVAEWNYDTPFAFQLLVSANPRPIRSSIWTFPDDLAIAGDAEAGLKHLNEYLARLPAQAEPLVTQTQAFLANPKNRRRYFILECGELFQMEGGDLAAQNRELLDWLSGLHARIQSLPLPAMDRSTASDDPLLPFYQLGLGNWSNILYFQFTEDEG